MKVSTHNERSWAGQLIAWIHEEIRVGRTIFQDATNDEGIKLESGRTKFPDVLLFSNKTSGIVFNGWELKFPDTAVDDEEMLTNALEKAARLKSNSFVTWNGTEAIVWGIDGEDYILANLKRLKIYPKEPTISKRIDLADKSNYSKNEYKLRERLKIILADLAQLSELGIIKQAINISSQLVSSIGDTGSYLIPQIKAIIEGEKGKSREFRDELSKWKVIEGSTLRLLASFESVVPEQVLARFIFYKLVGKIVFYLSLQKNIPGKLEAVKLVKNKSAQEQLEYYFNQAKAIDYQAVFEADFTDSLIFNATSNELLAKLIITLTEFDFKILPTEVIGSILENLVPIRERKQFGQYFSPELLTYLVGYPVVNGNASVLLDPTSGTGSFLNAFYNILKYHGQSNHQELLSQIWGNDISHFPAILSVINLYKQNIESAETGNFPRIIRQDFFDLKPGQIIKIPDNNEIDVKKDVQIPLFDGISSNFPFVQQEDLLGQDLTAKFATEFNRLQPAFINGGKFEINQRADYYTYCFYNCLKFLKPGGYLSAVTSNAWLGKNYGLQFKQFLLDNFSIKYIVKSSAGHWFQNAQVSTIFIVLKQGASTEPTRFITIHKTLSEAFNGANPHEIIRRVSEFYEAVDTCELPGQSDWQQDATYGKAYEHKNLLARVSLVSTTRLRNMITSQENWESLFLAEDVFETFNSKLVNPSGLVFQNGRGTRTGQDKLFVLSTALAAQSQIESRFLQPALKSSTELDSIHHTKAPSSFLFVCAESEETLRKHYPHAYNWVKKWERAVNEKGVPLPTVLEKNRPYWYTLRPEAPASIVTSINPDKKLFFSYVDQPIHLNQRLVAIRPITGIDVKLVAAILNSVVTLLIVEINGTARNLGALDLNADFFKTKIRILNPLLLSVEQRKSIVDAFGRLSSRVILPCSSEFDQNDRMQFDKTVLKSFGYSEDLLPQLYLLLRKLINDRITMSEK